MRVVVCAREGWPSCWLGGAGARRARRSGRRAGMHVVRGGPRGESVGLGVRPRAGGAVGSPPSGRRCAGWGPARPMRARRDQRAQRWEPLPRAQTTRGRAPAVGIGGRLRCRRARGGPARSRAAGAGPGIALRCWPSARGRRRGRRRAPAAAQGGSTCQLPTPPAAGARWGLDVRAPLTADPPPFTSGCGGDLTSWPAGLAAGLAAGLQTARQKLQPPATAAGPPEPPPSYTSATIARHPRPSAAPGLLYNRRRARPRTAPLPPPPRSSSHHTTQPTHGPGSSPLS
jgi:hypothetical protein